MALGGLFVISIGEVRGNMRDRATLIRHAKRASSTSSVLALAVAMVETALFALLVTAVRLPALVAPRR